MSIKQELAKPYVGEIIELYEIDLNPIGVNQIIRITPHSENNVTWRGETYIPFPVVASGVSRSNNAAPGRINLTASTASAMLTSVMTQYGDLVGAKVTKWRTLGMFLDGKPTADPNQHWPKEYYFIIQRSEFNIERVTWVLATMLDKPGIVVPRRQCLKDIASRHSLYAPGMARIFQR